MESSFSIHETDGLLYVHVRGEVTVDGLIDMVRRSRQDPSFRDGMSSVCDLRESHGQWDYSETQRYRDFIVHIAGTHKRRWAMVVRPGALAAALHVIILISDQIGDIIQMQVFDDPERARRWARREID
ncbi:MAG TPA: hypothetical protein PKE27_12705 [Povalibacter sp.]|uniref:hypothetical protein n=1 Tax=Povalibacter sp. TaxID=1962978 RepID=UPI002D1118D2|nr:hypothetical protein [Povalibacter sp.]HMN45435.1 hypothetical protein [Povalibacter sp.]